MDPTHLADPIVPAEWQVVRTGLVTPYLSRSNRGVSGRVRRFAREMEAQSGLEIDVFGPAGSGKDLSEWAPLNLRTASPIGPQFLSFAPGLLRRVMDANLHLLHLHGLWKHTSAVSHGFTRRTGRPHLVSPHGMLGKWALQNLGWREKLAAALFDRANFDTAACCHGFTTAEADSIREFGFRGPVCVIPNGVDLPPPATEPPATPWWSKNEPSVRTLLYLGMLHPKKGLPKLMSAWSRLDKETLRRWRLVIAGWDERGHQLTLRRMARTLCIEATVTFPGPLFGEEKRAALHHCDGFILPSLGEGLPMSLLEAWAHGKPVLMTPQCNLPQGYEVGAAMRIDSDQESIKAALLHFMALDDADRQRMGARGRELVAKCFSWPVVSAEMAGVYRWLAGRGPRPASVSGA